MPDIANDLPGLHLLTGSYTDGRTVCIQSFQPSAVIDLDVIAVAAAPAVKAIGNSDHAICGGENRRTLAQAMSVPVWELTSPVMGSTR